MIASGYFRKIFYLLLLGLLFIHNCSKPSVKDRQEVLAIIDDSVKIYKNEFIKRAEYTIRPVYCNKDYYVHKKIVLNSLIAEKMLAMEEENNNSKLLQNPSFRAYIKGRQEQAMRQEIYREKAKNSVRVSQEEVEKLFSNVQREYHVEYISFHNKKLFQQIQQMEEVSEMEYRDFFEKLYPSLDEIPQRVVKWEITEDYDVLRNLYLADIAKPIILKPFQIGYQEYLWIRILDWKNNKVLFAPQIEKHRHNIRTIASKIKQDEAWNNFVGKIMRKKSIRFDKETLNKIGKLYYNKYFVFRKDEKKDIKTALVNKSYIKNKETYNLKKEMKKNNLLSRKFFEIDNKEWTVADFLQLLNSHPLVYRNRRMTAAEFPTEFKLAVVDLIRDYFITQYGYKKGFDTHPTVVQETEMWKDALLSEYNKINYVKTQLDSTDYKKLNQLKIIQKYMNKYVDRLQNKYNKKVQINFDLLESIKLTKINLITRNNFQPYNKIVPEFPILTTDYHLEYTTKMK